MKPSVCIEMIFNDLPVVERLDATQAAGCGAYEFWGWRNKPLDELARRASELGLACSALSCNFGGPLVHEIDCATIETNVTESCAAANKLNAPAMIITTGNEDKDMERAAQHANVVRNLKIAAPIVADHGLTLVLEPLNVLVDHAGYFLVTSTEGFEIVREVGQPSVKLLFDIYHQQISEGNLIQNMTANLDLIGHLHMADVPGRHQAGTGEINYREVFRRVAEAGYDGFCGLEFRPVGDHTAAVRQTLACFPA